MNCNCISELEKKVADKYAADLGKPVEVKCTGAAIVFGKTVSMAHKTPFIVKADAPGYRKGKDVSFFASFCPFCGKSTKEAAPVDDTPPDYHPV